MIIRSFLLAATLIAGISNINAGNLEDVATRIKADEAYIRAGSADSNDIRALTGYSTLAAAKHSIEMGQDMKRLDELVYQEKQQLRANLALKAKEAQEYRLAKAQAEVEQHNAAVQAQYEANLDFANRAEAARAIAAANWLNRN